MSSTLITIIASAIGFLAIATITNFLLLYKTPKNATFLKVKVIIHSWWWIIGFILLCLSWAPLGLLIGFGLVGILGLREYLKYSALSSLKTLAWLVQLPLIALQVYALHTTRWDLFFLAPVLAALICFPLMTIKSALISQLPLIFSSFVGLTFLLHFLFYVPALYILIAAQTSADAALIFVTVLFTLTFLNDVLQFVFGKSFGKRKIVPGISPNKTLAGFIGGWFGTCILAITLLYFLTGIPPITGFLVGSMISCFGMAGDLTFSAIKRYFGTKDFSTALPGHGGILDRCDSLIFTAPATFILIYLLGGVSL